MLMSSVCIHKVTVCFKPASVAIRLASQLLEMWKLLGSILVTRCGTTAGMSWTTLPRVPISFPVVYICLDLLRDTCMTSDSPQTPTWSKPSPPVYMHLTSVSSIAGCKQWWQDGINSYMSMVITWSPDVYRLMWMCHVGLYVEVGINFRHQSLCCNIFLKLLCVYYYSLFYSLFVSSSGAELPSVQSHFWFWSTANVDKHWNSLGGMPVHLKVIIATE